MYNYFLNNSFFLSGFIEKNKDSFSQDLKNLIKASQLELLANIFKTETNNTANKNTLSSQFRKSLDILVHNLSQCHPFFVRCIKPNEFKKAGVRN